MNYMPGTSSTKGNSGYGTNRATDNTYGFYIPSGDYVKYIEWGDLAQNRSNDCATYGGRFYECVYPGAWGSDGQFHNGAYYSPTFDDTYRAGPLALGLGADPRPMDQAILDAYYRNGQAEQVGWIRDNGGSEWVHSWGNGAIQDVAGNASTWPGGLMRPNSRSWIAYWVHGAIWSTYLANGGGPGWLGYPLSDEFDWHSDCGENARVRTSNFEGGYISYSCTSGRFLAAGRNNAQLLQNPSFESIVVYWNRFRTDTSWTAYVNDWTGAHNGQVFLEFNPGPSQTWTSVAQEVPYPVSWGSFYTASAWVRCRAPSCTVNLAVWALKDGLPAVNFSSGDLSIPNGLQWQSVSASGIFYDAYDRLRFEVYNLSGSNQNIDIDDATLVRW